MNRRVAVGISAALAAAACHAPDTNRSSASGAFSDASFAQPASAQGSTPESSPSPPGDARGVVFLPAPPGSVAAIVREAVAPAAAARRTLVVYVGASWCEPCQRFHHAAEAGALDGALPRLALLEFDADRDHDRLAAAGYDSKYIPLFALASADGTSSPHRQEGAVKGEGAVDFIVPRLQALLTRWGDGAGR